MKKLARVRIIDGMVLAVIGVFIVFKIVSAPKSAAVETDSDFAAQVDLEPLFRAAVHADGRLRSFESHAKTYMGYVSGARRINGHTRGYTYLDLMMRPERYRDVPLIYIKNKVVRQQVVDALQAHVGLDDAAAARMQKTGLLPRSAFQHNAVQKLLHRLGQDLIRSAKAVDAIQSALTVSDPAFLQAVLKLVPTRRPDQPWVSMDDIVASETPDDPAHADLVPVDGLDDDFRDQLTATWESFQAAWRDENAGAVNGHLQAMVRMLRSIAPEYYPDSGRLAMESWYFRYDSMTWVWLLYLVCAVPLLMSVIYKWDGARSVGMVLFFVAFAFQTGALALRWYISGRWPNANMFEATTTAAWFGGVLAIILERVVRKTPFRNLFALASAVVSMVTLMAAHFLPTQLDSSISNKMAALNDVWLYIHTNVIIWSYGIIGLACIPALLLLRQRWCDHWDSGLIPKWRLFILPVVLAAWNYTGWLLLMHVINHDHQGLSRNALITVSGVFWASLLHIVLEVWSAHDRRVAGITSGRAASGGASALLAAAPGGSGFLKEKPTAAQVYDGATMVLVELSFIMLWTGVVMGAIWADHSWGRPWGWDPKEVFALNTFLIFLVLIHVRLKVKDKAFWTAILAIIGFEVMMFNWIVVNFVITGLHSYA